MDLRQLFAANLRRLRNAKGMSQDDVAYEAEMSRSYLSKLDLFGGEMLLQKFDDNVFNVSGRDARDRSG